MLNDKETKLLAFIVSEMEEKGYPPSIREMMEAIGVKSLRGVTYHLDELQKKSYIHRERKSRSISLLPRAYSLKSEYESRSTEKAVPILGKVAAGNPIFAEEEITDYIVVPKSITKNNNNHYALRVSGDSMIGDHILNHDIVIIRRQNFASNGEIVIAVINDYATIKRFFKESGYYRLQPSNPDYEPIITKDIEISGVMVGLIRNFIN